MSDELPFVTLSELLKKLSDFMSSEVNQSCNCAFGELRKFWLGRVTGDVSEPKGAAFLANREIHLGFVLVISVSDITRRKGKNLPFLDGSDFYYRFPKIREFQSFYATGIWDSEFGWCMGEEQPIAMAKTWVPAACAQPAIAVYPAEGHVVDVYAVYLYPPPECTSSSGGGGNGNGGNGGGFI